jgi:hypothetical protein
MKIRVAFFLGVLVLCSAFSVQASTMDDVIALNQKNVGEDVLLAMVDKDRSRYALGASDIVRLKDARVPEKVILAMIRHRGTEIARVEQSAPAERVVVQSTPTVVQSPPAVVYANPPVYTTVYPSVVYGYPYYRPYWGPYFGFGYHTRRFGFGVGW